MKEKFLFFLFVTLCTTVVIKAENTVSDKGYETQMGTCVSGDNAKSFGVVTNENEANTYANFVAGTAAHLNYESVKTTTL